MGKQVYTYSIRNGSVVEYKAIMTDEIKNNSLVRFARLGENGKEAWWQWLPDEEGVVYNGQLWLSQSDYPSAVACFIRDTEAYIKMHEYKLAELKSKLDYLKSL